MSLKQVSAICIRSHPCYKQAATIGQMTTNTERVRDKERILHFFEVFLSNNHLIIVYALPAICLHRVFCMSRSMLILLSVFYRRLQMCNQGGGYVDQWRMGGAGKTWFQG